MPLRDRARRAEPERRVPASTVGLPPWLRHAVRTACHVALDGAAVALAYRAAFWLRFQCGWFLARFPTSGEPVGWENYQGLLLAAVPIWLVLFYLNKLYTEYWSGASDRFLQIVRACALGTGATLVAAFLYERLAYSRVMLAGVFPFGVAFVSVAQALALWIDETLARLERAKPVLLVGGGPVAQLLRERILDRHPGARVVERETLPSEGELERLLDASDWYELILLKTNASRDGILAAAEACDVRGMGFRMVPDLLEIRMGEVQMDPHLGVPAYRIKHTSFTRANFLAKRVFDLVFSTVLLVVTAPVWLLAALAIKLDSKGPVLFTQKRFGHKGRVFHAYKFRTMVADAEARVHAVKTQGLDGQKGAFFKAKDDPRVTRVGKWLRRFSFDEFPQFLNVLRGEMSVVGPRPLAVTTGEREALEAEFGPVARKRLNILPGITGLWQVSGRSDVSSEQRFGLDLFYIEHWTLGLDLEIIVKTPAVMLFGKGAY